MKHETKTYSSASARLRAARLCAPSAAKSSSKDLDPQDSKTREAKPLSVAQMLAANERALLSRGRCAYSRRAILAAQRLEGQGADSSNAPSSEPKITLEALRAEARAWNRGAHLSGLSARFIAERERIVAMLLWFAEREGFGAIGKNELEAYFGHLRDGHRESAGRFGRGHVNNRCFQEPRPATIQNHYKVLSTLWNFLRTERHLVSTSPFEHLPRPRLPTDTDVMPFTEGEIAALLDATKRSIVPARDKAILLLLLDTGLRASEFCSLTIGDLDERQNALVVRGKGNKRRIVYFGKKCQSALWKHLTEQGELHGARDERAPLFSSEVGACAGGPMQPRSLGQLFKRTAERAGVKRAHPHKCRHTFAINFLRNGGNQISLMRLLGHTDLTMTARYVAYTQADLEEQHRKFSPMDGMK